MVKNKKESKDLNKKENNKKTLKVDENKKTEKKNNPWYIELIPYVIILVVVLLIRFFIFTPAVVDGPSMKPTLHNNEWLIVYKFTKIDRNDVIVFKYDGRYLVKRVIGLPNDTVKCEDGKIFVNNKELKDKYTIEDNTCTGEVTLKDDEYFVLGDNRAVSMDSRIIGPVKKEKVLGTTNFRIFPFTKIGTFK